MPMQVRVETYRQRDPYRGVLVPAPGPGSPVRRSAVMESAPLPTPASPRLLPQAVAAVIAPERPWTDLADNRPGEAAREHAVARRWAAPTSTAIARVLRVNNDERSWRIGAEGEAAVAVRLSRLGPEWKVLHAIQVGHPGHDIDHLVIGPGGVYTVNAKHHPDSTVWVAGEVFTVNGHAYSYVRTSRFEAARVADRLSRAIGSPVFARGLVVVGAHKGPTIKSQPPGGDVYVLRRRDVDGWLSRRGRVLDAGQVERIYSQARKSTIWTAP